MTSPHASITDHTLKLGDHEMFYHAGGPEDGPLVVFAHGWPELGHSWRHQLPVLGGLGLSRACTRPAWAWPLDGLSAS